ncbi:alpha-2-macroglobulin family protein [Sediminicola luteus]|uniref:Alpha-2-macroglobulin family protein n=1 Tax=Sediminicola luteus TaxID=319238 RepID=A0ABV2TT34_9FLAO
MKHLAFLLPILLCIQLGHGQINGNTSYDPLWKEVSQLEEKSLTKSALEVVKTISQKAKKEQNSPQTIKALLYSSKYLMVLEEESQLTIVNEFKSEIAQATTPTKNILESYLANLYWQYYQQNRFEFYNRTKTESKVDLIDFRTWDLSTLFEEISIHFERSLENTEELQKLDINLFKEILNQQKDSRAYRPTLYDVLAHTALDFYRTSENGITNPSYKFELDKPEYFAPAEEFSALPLIVKDSSSLQLKALKLYQELLTFHQKDPSRLALANVDLERLRFIKQYSIIEEADQFYLDALKNSATSYREEVAALFNYEIAALYDQWANNYDPKTDVTQQWKRKEALEICNAIIEKYPKSRAAENSLALKTQILSKNLQLKAESHLQINLPSRILVNYKNMDGLKLTAHIITEDEKAQLEKIYPIEKQSAFIKRLPVAKQWTGTLKNVGDYQNHSTEILLPALPNGSYTILAVNDATFAFQTVQVTDLAIVQTRGANEQMFQVINRANGYPVSGAQVTFSYQTNYNGPLKEHIYLTDKQGFIVIQLSDDRWTNLTMTVRSKEDVATFGTYFISKKTDINNPTETSYFSSLFLDRSIYRPGQVVFFKGIAIKRNNVSTSILNNTKVVATLLNANSQEVGRQEYTTNDYGSFNGQFILPNYGLTGEYSLVINSEEVNLSGQSNFSVEEYKRPKFKTRIDPVTETYKVNDSILLTGTATAFAGSTITNAKVNYTVRRIVEYPVWYYWSRPYVKSTAQEIAHGETITNEEGKYEFKFKAIPDSSIPEEDLPIFTYEVTVDVTDINGETHSTSKMVRVGYHSLLAKIIVPNRLDKSKSDQSIEISTTNLNGQEVPAKGTLKIYKLKGPDNVLRERPWPAPEFSSFTKEEFKTLFPYEPYSNEEDPTNWEKGALVWQADFDTEKMDKLSLGQIKSWESGRYAIELESTDRFGKAVKDVVHTTAFWKKDKNLADNQLFDLKTDKEAYALGETAKLTLATSAKSLKVTLFIEKDKKNIETIIVPLSNNSKTISIPIGATDLGGFAIRYSFSAFNGFVTGTQSISVPYPSTQLDVETITFRDKLAPGAEEKWSFKIKGPKGEKVAAEVLASMYDASLDSFREHNWYFSPLEKSSYHSIYYSNAHQSFGTVYFNTKIDEVDSPQFTPQGYDSFNWFNFYFGTGNRMYRTEMMMKNSGPIAMEDSEGVQEQAEEVIAPNPIYMGKVNDGNDKTTVDKESEPEKVQIRRNLQETAFFFPKLMTDPEGNVTFSFLTPEALTQWKLQLLAHTATLESTVRTFEALTQKELMVTPNIPRFLREGDTITISSKISNLTDHQLTGKATILLEDALTGKDITYDLLLSSAEPSTADEKEFKVASKNNTQVSWTITIPKNLQAVQFTVMAKAGDFSDGEQNTLPVLTNRMLVTETMPMWVSGIDTKTFTLDKLKETTSTTRSNHKLTLEITSNPAWYALQALPYLMEYPYECNEQIFSRLYANTLANHITKSNPKIKSVFDQWAKSDALVSDLEKNQALKSILIQETPWLRDAQSETEKKKRIALLFNSNHVAQEQQLALNKLLNNQMSNGAWAWFHGGPANRYITQHILAGIGHLRQLDTGLSDENARLLEERALGYLQGEFIAEYEEMKKHMDNINGDHLSAIQIHYLYIRSLFKDQPESEKVQEAVQYYLGQAKKYWTKKSLYEKGMIALVFHRQDMASEAEKIMQSLKENSIESEELGMYWKENTASWYWHQSPIETQALMIEAFAEIGSTDPLDNQIIEHLKIWLLKNKQTNNWQTTKATTDAIYALLLEGNDWLSITEAVDVRLGGNRMGPWKLDSQKKEQTPIEAGSGYYQTSWKGIEIKPEMAEVQLSKKGNGIAWGALYWQYFEDLDKITPAKSPLQLDKKLFLKRNTDLGEELKEITEDTPLNVGDLVRTRIVVKVDRKMEFIHLKDMRAAGLEPINVISQYKWQDGLGYYESTKDAATNFFFDNLPKGVFVFEYDLRVNNTGVFSNGITTIQSMYAPEFSSHSEGTRIRIMEK